MCQGFLFVPTVEDLHHFNPDPGPDPSFHCDLDPDPTFHFDADPTYHCDAESDLIKVMLKCDHKSADPPWFLFDPPWLHFDPPHLLNSDYDVELDPLTVIRIRLFTLMRIRIQSRTTDTYRTSQSNVLRVPNTPIE
jgi:hypothetical protein